MTYRWIDLLAGLVLLGCAGCANQYMAAKDVPTATIIFSSGAPRTDGVMVQAFGDRNCGKSTTGTRVAYFYRELFDDRAGAAKTVTAGRDFVFTFRSRSDTGTVATFCNLTRSFVPEPSATYRAHFVSSPDRCDVQVTRVTSTDPAGTAGAPVDVSIVDPICLNDFNG